jgi:hypothetical protein
MEQAKKALETDGGLTKAGFVGITNVLVSLTYTFMQPPIEIGFNCKMAMDQDDKAARQAFYSQPDGDIEAGQFRYNVDMLSRIVVARPVGLPGFKLDGDPGSIKKSDIAAAIQEYFSSGEPMLQKVAADAIERYSLITQPAEFFR